MKKLVIVETSSPLESRLKMRLKPGLCVWLSESSCHPHVIYLWALVYKIQHPYFICCCHCRQYLEI